MRLGLLGRVWILQMIEIPGGVTAVVRGVKGF